MGTYTTNKELYMPTVGEQGWGTLVNGNFETIDTFLKPISLSGSTYTFTGNQNGGSISATSITNSGTLTNTGTSTFTGKITGNGGIGTTSLTTTSTITSTGKITANGGIGTTSLTTSSTITSTGLITANGGIKGRLFVNGQLSTSGTTVYATCAAQSVEHVLEHGTDGNTSTLTVNGYTRTLSFPHKVSPGIYINSTSDVSGSLPTSFNRTLKVEAKKKQTGSSTSFTIRGVYINGTNVISDTYTSADNTEYKEITLTNYTVKPGDKIYVSYTQATYCYGYIKITINASNNYYVSAV